ncbi:DNA replication regulator SLD3-domain-containing protein [Phaeosphaeria sp. MPI-PUGE-AT-0046c]|nr:DNA replication regulator SLD3-domain-containing protein [Phaeosphaeria sp. MPI-PUGE-AT-0046c]
MSVYALQTMTMLQAVSENPLKLLGVDANREQPKPQLPTKRRRDELCGLGKSNKPFTIKPHPESPYAKPAVFKPVRIIGRSQLPLTFLDTTPDETFVNNSLFASHIDVLESDVSTKEDDDNKTPRVLIARYETKRTLYAIERVQARIYSICRLTNWLKEKDVAELWDPSSLQVYPTTLLLDKSTPESNDWWKYAAVEASALERPSKRVRMTMMRRKPVPEPVEEKTQQFDCPQASGAHATASVFVGDTEDHYNPPSPQEQLESLVQQYLDALYMSKTSLAYFAKGPMTRIRNAFTSPEEGAAPTHELVTFLRSMILTLKAGEKKYFEKLPAIIRALPPSSLSEEEQLAGASKPRKTRKKMKLSREGLYGHEGAVVRKWWFSDVSCGDPQGDETLDQRIKRRIGELRVRETLAQVILMLEIIALEALTTYKPAPEDQPMDETQPQEETQTKIKKRKRKLDDIGLQLEFLLDRLGIWHDTGEAGILNYELKQTQQHGEADGSGKGLASDRLREFCIEVVNPFYMNRLPEQARIVNKKLGGPAHSTPSKRKAMRPPATSRKSGEAQEPDAKKSRRSLARVATDTVRRSTDRFTPALSRSATDSALIKGIKREGSEAPLSAIPFSRSPSRDNRRSMSHFQYLAAREVDLTTPSATATAKLKQKKRVDEEVKEAITALRKPNRGLAAGGYVDENERRSLGLASRSRKQANPVRRVGTDVQVSQTPKAGRRTKNMVEQTPTHHHHISNPFTRFSTSAAPPSGDFCIPPAGARHSDLVPGTVQRSATGRRLARDGIAETPSKAPSTKAFESGVARRTIFATPTKANVATLSRDSNVVSHIFETPAKVVGSSPFTTNTTQAAAITVTPTKPSSARPSEGRQLVDSKKAEAEEPSIYAALGWDDEDDGLL